MNISTVLRRPLEPPTEIPPKECGVIGIPRSTKIFFSRCILFTFTLTIKSVYKAPENKSLVRGPSNIFDALIRKPKYVFTLHKQARAKAIFIYLRIKTYDINYNSALLGQYAARQALDILLVYRRSGDDVVIRPLTRCGAGKNAGKKKGSTCSPEV